MHKQLNYNYLILHKLITLSNNSFNAQFKLFKDVNDNEFVFSGQRNKKGEPDGLVRAIFKIGNVYEGQMSADGLFSGWGCEYTHTGFISIGHFESSNLHGDAYHLDQHWNIRK